MNTSLEHPLNGRCNLYLFVIPRFDTLAVDGWAVTFGTALWVGCYIWYSEQRG